jgi:hypothetical protein
MMPWKVLLNGFSENKILLKKKHRLKTPVLAQNPSLYSAIRYSQLRVEADRDRSGMCVLRFFQQ